MVLRPEEKIMADQVSRIVVLTDSPEPSQALLAVIRARAAQGPSEFHVLMPDPAASEVHLLHPERHLHAVAALDALLAAVPAYAAAAGGPVRAGVSIRHDPFEAVEELTLSEPVQEIIVAVADHKISTRLHHDVAHRLAHLGRPVTSVPVLVG
jgi:hypothetical protein